MSAEKSGTKGYEFQYLESLLIALEYLDKDEIEVYIEKSEDAQIKFNKYNKKYIIDIQVKHRNEDINIKEFAKWISHFESRKSNYCLLNKLENDNRFALFISNARCKDEVSSFIDRDNKITESNVSLKTDNLKSIKEAIKNSYNNNTKLNKNRNEFLNEFIDNIKDEDLNNILTKIKIKELYSEEYSMDRVKSLLNKKFYVPQSKTNSLILELLDKIRDEIATDKSIAEDLNKIIIKYSNKVIINRDKHHVERIEKERCKKILDSENVLLLTGVSFCGKSYLAKDIAQDYIEEGYNIMLTGELYGDGGAIRFITSRDIEDRLLILEDPFGQIETKQDSRSILAKVRELVGLSQSNRKIIITSRIDIVFKSFSKLSIKECNIGTYNWIDLTDVRMEDIEYMWQNYYGMSEKSIKNYNRVINNIKQSGGKSSILLGHISKIYNSYKSLDEVDSLEINKIIKSARIDSEDLSNIIDERGNIAIKIFITLGLCCNTYRQLNINDLEFILGDLEEYPGIVKIKNLFGYKASTLNESEKNNELKLSDSKFEYKFTYGISNKYKEELKYLINHGYIEIDNLKRIIFSHPIYHYASQLLFKKYFEDIFEKNEVIKIVNRSLYSLSVNSQLCTLSILEDYYEENSDDTIKRLILKSLNSIFPSSRDRVIMFCDKKINDLEKDLKEDFIYILGNEKFFEYTNIYWHEGIPYFRELSDVFDVSEYLLTEVESNNFNEIMNKLDTGNIISSEEMWYLLNEKNSEDISIEILEKSITYDESFIRGKAIELIFKNFAFEFSQKKLDGFLNVHEHYNVIYNLFKGALSSWSKYNEESRSKIVNYLKNSLDIMSVCIKIESILKDFGNEYSYPDIKWDEVNEKEILWNTWYEIYVSFFNKFPIEHVSMDEVHMFNITDKSLEFIKDEEKVVELSIAWINWLNRKINYGTPTDYAMGVAEYLMKGTDYQSSFRKDIVEKMLLVSNTSLITTNVFIFIKYWEKLSYYEKKYLLDLYKKNRNDIEWIKAISLNGDSIPDEIQIEILGEVINNKDISYIVDILIKNNLLQQCLNIYCGYPGILYWNGYNHRNEEFWNKIIVEVLSRDELNMTYKIALREVIDLLYNENISRIPEIYNIYEEILLKNDEKRKLTFEELMKVTATQNQSNKKMWDLLFKYSSKEEVEIYYTRIVEDIEIIQDQQSVYNGLFELFDKEVIYKEIYTRLEEDELKKYSSLSTFLEFYLEFPKYNEFDFLPEKELNKINESLELIKYVFEELSIKLLEKNNIRLFSTMELINSGIKKLNIKSPKLNTLIEKNRRRLNDVVRKSRQKYNDNYDLNNWNY